MDICKTLRKLSFSDQGVRLSDGGQIVEGFNLLNIVTQAILVSWVSMSSIVVPPLLFVAKANTLTEHFCLTNGRGTPFQSTDQRGLGF